MTKITVITYIIHLLSSWKVPKSVAIERMQNKVMQANYANNML